MNSLVIYDSLYGNTEKIAREMGRVLGAVDVVSVGMVKMEQLKGVDLLVVGSPTQRLQMTRAMKAFLAKIPAGALEGVQVATFDTRLPERTIKKNAILAFFVKMYGFAADPIAKGLAARGGCLAARPEGFFVEGMEGPLVAGELERAAEWARKLLA